MRKFNLFLFLVLMGCQTGEVLDNGGGEDPPISESPETSTVEAPVQNKSIAFILGPGFGRSAYYTGFFKALEQCRVRPAVLSGSGTGLLFARLYGFNRKTFEWNVFRLSSVQWWIDPEESGANEKRKTLEESFTKLYQNTAGDQIPIFFPSQRKLSEAGNLQNLISHFYFPGLLSGPKGGMVYTEIQTNPYPVDDVKKLGFEKVVVVDLISDIPKRPVVPGLDKSTHQFIASIETLSAIERKRADHVWEPALGVFPIKALMKNRMGDLKSLGLNDTVRGLKNMGLTCE